LLIVLAGVSIFFHREHFRFACQCRGLGMTWIMAPGP
jgi:hypothetical protein